MIIYHLSNLSNSETDQQLKSLLRSSETDFRLALALVDRPFHNPALQQQANILSADLAQKLSDFEALQRSYLRVVQMAASNPQVGYIVLSLAPSLADWRLFYRMASVMEEDYKKISDAANTPANAAPNVSEALHQMAENGMPDLGVLYEQLKRACPDGAGKADFPSAPKPDKLFQQTVWIKKTEICLERVMAESPEREEEIRKEFEENRDNEVQMENLSISVNGGLLVMPGLSKEVPQILYGPYSNEHRLEAEAYTDLQLQETDEKGELKTNMSSEEMYAELMNNMPPQVIEAINSGELTPEQMIKTISSGGSDPVSGNPELWRSLNEFTRSFQESGSDMMKKYGLSLVRQHERLVLKKVEGGYEGTYSVRNFNPTAPEVETSVEFALHFDCEHLKSPPVTFESDVDKVASGVDGLVLD
ncbi:hypothetical protein MHBO_001849 [Bonamia ostreae]|uniref:Uncharacterized protein n=1 Tax=Bonamia ostreae TaxID=126728 RepID=A0ABV2AKE4_9EUKA